MSFTFLTTGGGIGAGSPGTVADGAKLPALRSLAAGCCGPIPFTIPTPTAAAQPTSATAQNDPRFQNGRDSAREAPESTGSSAENWPVGRSRGSITGGTVPERAAGPDAGDTDAAAMLEDEERRSAMKLPVVEMSGPNVSRRMALICAGVK